ncbi:MAG: hypothetical protein HKN23_04590 [Verrucomicrobiales bacterium]|nr:hypothetical protein [Verrucomicrobiales bacterium]
MKSTASSSLFRVGTAAMSLAAVCLCADADDPPVIKKTRAETSKNESTDSERSGERRSEERSQSVQQNSPADPGSGLIAATFAPATQDPDEMTLVDLQGRSLDARLISANGEVVKIQRLSDDLEFELRLDQLDEVSARRVTNWIERDPDAADYSMKFEVEKRLSESDSFEAGGRSLKTNQWVYDVKLTNVTRNELKGAMLEYRIIFDDKVAFTRTSAFPGKGPKQQEGEEVALPEMGFNDRAEFTTPSVQLHTYEYSPTRGQKDFERDKLLGIWIRITKRGEVIDEFRSNEAVLGDLAWDAEEELEIEVVDSFKKNFEEPEETESTR